MTQGTLFYKSTNKDRRRSLLDLDESGGNPSRSSEGFKFKLLDLFCCAGGAGIGYSRAGFDVVGVDIKPQPNYPLPFIQADVLDLGHGFISLFDAIHASPPCQSYSDLAKRNGNADAWPRLIDPVREMLIRSGVPYIIENVEGAPLHHPVMLCGTMFKGLRVIRHRLFEVNFPVLTPKHGKHPKVHTFDKRKSHYGKTNDMRDFVQVTGGGNCTIAAARDAMKISWMTKGELNEAIPPAYTQFIGKQLIEYLVAQNRLSCGDSAANANACAPQVGSTSASITA
jgi:DNA (cytosine-5)-methyltransferase 1